MATLAPAAATKAPRPGSGEEDRTRQLVQTAYDLLKEHGLDGLTIRAVLSRSGLARRAFYERFAGKDDLVLAVFEQTLLTAADFFREQAPPGSLAADRLLAIVEGIVLGGMGLGGHAPAEEDDRRSAALSREHLRLAESRPAELQAALRPLLGLIAEVVADGIARGEFRQADPALQAALIYNLVSTTVHTELLAEEGARADGGRRQRIADEIWEFCRRAIAA